MNIEREQVGGCPLLRVTGEVDLHTRRRLKDELEPLVSDPSHRKVGLDLGSVNFMDSSAASFLWETQRRMQRAGRELVVTDASPSVRRLCSMLERAGMQFSA